MRRRILVIPTVSELDSLSRLVAHIGHYFSHVRPERITVLVESGLLRGAEAWLESPSLPPAFDERVLDRIHAVRETIDLKPWRPIALESLALTSDLVLDWDVRGSELEPWKSIKSGYRPDRTLFTVDWHGIRQGAAYMAEAAKVLVQDRMFDRSQAEKMIDLIRRLSPVQRAYLVGTGPSSRCALDQDLSDGIRIVCNTAILDDELMEHVRPHVLTFADPIFHFGPSTYAQRFQRVLVEQADKHDFTVVTTERYAPLLRAHAPKIAERVIGLRQGAGNWPDTFDLRSNAAIRPYPNVLTMLMLPIAATLARSIGLIGFDGRSPNDEYFWRHGSTVQFDQELEDIRLVHPGFFEIDYADYYSEHIATVERIFAQLEERGTKILPLAESYVPALRRRAARRPVARPLTTSGSGEVLVSLTPDWIGDSGHFGPLERRIHEAAEAAGHMHIALASAGLQPTADWQVPTFSEASFAPDSGSRFAPVGQHFEDELRAVLDQLRLGHDSVVFFYTADVWHLASLLAVAGTHPRLRFVVNLMRSHGWIDRALEDPDPWVDGLVDLLRSCLIAASGTTVTVAVDTEALARDVELLTGQAVAVWPMIAVSRTPRGSIERGDANGVVHVVSPVQAQNAKGFPELVALAERFSGRLERGELRLTARWPAAGTAPGMVRMAERLEKQGVRLIRDSMTDEGFAELIASADVALIPYQVRPFRTRTSGVTVDALLAGKPVVAIRGTWSGDLIERYGAGLTYSEGNVAEMEGALSQVISHRDAYRRRLAEMKSAVEAEHAPQRLIEFLRAGPRSTELKKSRPTHVENLRQRTDQLRRVFRWHVISEGSTRIAAAIREDDQRRGIDRLKDEVDSLKRSVAHRDRARAIAEAKVQSQPGRGNAKRRRSVSRGRGIRQALAGSLGPVLVTTGVLSLSAGGLAVTGYEGPALLAVAAAAATSVMGSLVVAVRLQRRISA